MFNMNEFEDYLSKKLETDQEFWMWWHRYCCLQENITLIDLYHALHRLKEGLEKDQHCLKERPEYDHYSPPISLCLDPRKVKALAACYELIDYLVAILRKETGETT